MAKIITTIAGMSVLLLILQSLHYQAAYPQMSNDMSSQNLSSLLKNLLGPQKQVSGHYSNPQFGITDIVFPDSWHGSELPPLVGLTVIMHQESENRSLSSLSDIISPIALAQPQMTLQVLNNSGTRRRTGQFTSIFYIQGLQTIGSKYNFCYRWQNF